MFEEVEHKEHNGNTMSRPKIDLRNFGHKWINESLIKMQLFQNI